MKITQAEIVMMAKRIAIEYRHVATELQQAALTLDKAANVDRDPFPLVRITRLKRAIELGVVLDHLIDHYKLKS